jgi:hypothetical protein
VRPSSAAEPIRFQHFAPMAGVAFTFNPPRAPAQDRSNGVDDGQRAAQTAGRGKQVLRSARVEVGSCRPLAEVRQTHRPGARTSARSWLRSLIGVWGTKQTEERGARRRSADADVGRPGLGGVGKQTCR